MLVASVFVINALLPRYRRLLLSVKEEEIGLLAKSPDSSSKCRSLHSGISSSHLFLAKGLIGPGIDAVAIQALVPTHLPPFSDPVSNCFGGPDSHRA